MIGKTIRVAIWLAILSVITSSVSAQISPYVYVKMSMGVPWFLYFVFLLAILLPFFVMIIVAWRRHLAQQRDQDPYS